MNDPAITLPPPPPGYQPAIRFEYPRLALQIGATALVVVLLPLLLTVTWWLQGRIPLFRLGVFELGLVILTILVMLQDYWSEVPPQHTPYNPPYMPEVVGHVLQPLARSQLYHLDILPEPPPAAANPASLTPLDPSRLSSELLSLFATACPPWPRADFPPPDEVEAEFLLWWLGQWPLWGWLAEVDDKPVGFLLLQPDLAPHLKRAGGGCRWWWRLWLAWAARRQTRQGRLLFMAVLPEYRRRGIGSQLLRQALSAAGEQGWQRLTIGPIPSAGPANKFLQHHGAAPRQTYLLYQQNL